MHRKKNKQSSIFQLQSEDCLLEEQEQCAGYLERQVEKLLLSHLPHDQEAIDTLLAEVEPVFSDNDNEMLASPSTEEDLKCVLSNSHLLAAPGVDGIPSLPYQVCWETVRGPLM